RDFLERLPDAARREGVGFILDRGFTSYGLLEDFRREGIGYVVPLKKNSKLMKVDEVGWNGTPFLYRKRPVRWACMESRYGRLYAFEDPELGGAEEAALLRRVERKEMGMREYEERKRVAGIIGLLSDMEMDGPRMYDLYKGREDIELAFDAMKNTLDADRTYLQSPEGVRGFFLVSFLAMRVHFKILKRLRERKLTGKVSVEEVLFELSKIERIVEKNGREYYASIPKKARNILSLFSDMLPMG
ncbi:MAG: transposase, partial [Nitrososphaerota archaeon]|nr:transposase [Nitrososphaerota archaeon]